MQLVVKSQIMECVRHLTQHKSSYGEPFPFGFNWTSLVERFLFFYLLFTAFHYRENDHLHRIFNFPFKINNHSSTAASPAGIKAKIMENKMLILRVNKHFGTRGISLLSHAKRK